MNEKNRIAVNPIAKNTTQEVSKSSVGANKSIFSAKQQEREPPTEVEKWKTRET